MASSITHAFVSSKADDADTTLVRPSNWNANHTIVIDSDDISGTEWTDLTDGGETSLHSHPGGAAYDATLTTGVSEFIEASIVPQPWETLMLYEDTVRHQDIANGNAIKLRVLQPIVMGDEFVHELYFLTSGTGEVILA